MQCARYNAQHLNSVDNIILCTKREAFSFLSFCYWWSALCVPPLLPVEVEFLGYHGEKNFLRPHGRMRYLGKPYSWCKIEGFPSKVPLPPISPRGKSDLVFSCQGSHLLRQPAQCCSKIPARKPLQCRAEWGEGSGSRPLSRLHQTASCCDSVTYCTKLPQS